MSWTVALTIIVCAICSTSIVHKMIDAAKSRRMEALISDVTPGDDDEAKP